MYPRKIFMNFLRDLYPPLKVRQVWYVLVYHETSFLLLLLENVETELYRVPTEFSCQREDT